MAKPTLPQGTRDFAPEIVRKRNYILDTIRDVFALYGFEPLETPAMENLETLMGKYGEEGDRLIFRILNNGLSEPRNQEKARAAFENVLQGKNDKGLTERALRYDLTIPFARFLAMHHGKLPLPFKRYQIQPVWRADRPQRGRYREFYQCDADIAGTRSLAGEVEFAHIYHKVFNRLGLRGYRLSVNSRKVLLALAETCGAADKLTDITVAIDKLDKIGLEQVKAELKERGLTEAQIELIQRYLSISGENGEKLQQAAGLLGDSPHGKAGLEELDFLLKGLGASPYAGSAPSTHSDKPAIDSAKRTTNSGAPPADLGQLAANSSDKHPVAGVAPSPSAVSLEIDFTLARGLNYYTGIIFEAKAPPAVQIGSIGGGGRYDDLTGLFGVPGIPGVGISFGVDRIYDVLEELNLFPTTIHRGTRALFLYPGEAALTGMLALAETLRDERIPCEVYTEPHKIDKQFKYAEQKHIPFVISANPGEPTDKPFRIKDIRSGETRFAAPEELAVLLM